MSADSQRRSAPSSTAARCMPAIVPPQAVSDRSIIDSVAGFINDVTLQTQTPQGDGKDHIIWARFETVADISDPCLGDDWELEGGVAPPLLLILGYVNGIQAWIIPANGEAIEVLSWRHGSVKCLRVLPTPTGGDGESASEPTDQYVHKRPLIALCDSASTGIIGNGGNSLTGGSGQFCSINFISLKDGENVKSIKFKNPIVDILANRSSVVVTFTERIAVFDARTLEDRLTVTTCHPSPGLNPNPVALGPRWIAYAEKKLLPSKRSSGGCDGDGVTSYTATVLNAAKSLGKGLRELGEQMAAGLTGSHSGPSSVSGLVSGSGSGMTSEGNQPGIVTILDIKYPIKDVSPTTGTPVSSAGNDPIIAHFVAHSEALVALQFDTSGMLLLTADKRGHDFHVFRIHPHPSGPSLAAVHHLYILHRGDTTAKVQDIAFSLDSRWVAISTLRGTTHVFPVTPYGGPAGVRTHGSPHVVNRLSRFHRSAGLSIDGRSSSPLSHLEHPASHTPTSAFANPRIPPFPHPTTVQPLAQLRQPTSLDTQTTNPTNTKSSSTGGRQRNSSSSSEDHIKPLRVCATFAKARSWLLDPPGSTRDTPAHRIHRKPVDSLFIIAAHGALIQYDLDPKHATNIPKEKVCDDTSIELEVEAKAQWILQRQESPSVNDIQPPLPLDNWLIKDRFLEEGSGDVASDYGSFDHHRSMPGAGDHRGSTSSIDHDDRWLSQVEIITHAGPHRRLWMGPQFVFKTYHTPSGSPLTSIDTESVEIGTGTAGGRPVRSNPVNMPVSGGMRPLVPVLIESGSCSSFEQSPRLLNMAEFRHHENLDTEFSSLGPVESQLREDLADAMRESPLISGRDTTGYASSTHIPAGLSSVSSCSSTSIYSSTHSLNSICDHKNPAALGSQTVVHATQHHHHGGITIRHHQIQDQQQHSSSLPANCSRPASAASSRTSGSITIAKVVNPLGTVTTISNVASEDANQSAENRTAQDCEVYMHENCDEALFRPVVTVCGTPGEERDRRGSSLDRITSGCDEEPAVLMSRELIVPVIEEKNMVLFSKPKKRDDENVSRFEQLSTINKKSKKDKPEMIETVPVATDRKMTEDFVNVEVVEQKTEVSKYNNGSKKKEKTPPVSARNDRKKKLEPEPIEIIEIVDPIAELEPVGKASQRNNKKKENGKRKEDNKQQQQVKAKSPPAETKPTKNSNVNSNNGNSTGNTRKESKQDNRKRKEKNQAQSENVTIQPNVSRASSVEMKVILPEQEITEKTVQFQMPEDEEMLKSICDEFPPLEALKIDDLELFGEANDPENMKIIKSEGSIQESLTVSNVMESDITRTELRCCDDINVELEEGISVEESQSVVEEDTGEVKMEVSMKKCANEEEFYELTSKYELEFPDPLPPLEPFECEEFEASMLDEKKINIQKPTSENQTLINFESPVQEQAKPVKKSIFDDKNIVFAMCSSLREGTLEVPTSQQQSGSRSLSTSMLQSDAKNLKQQNSVDGQDSDYKSLELEVDDSAMYTSQMPTSSASDEENSNSNNDDHDHRTTKKPSTEDEDEELQPLISSNKTSSSSLSATALNTVAGSGPIDSLNSSMTASGIVAVVGSPAKTPTIKPTLPTTEANQSDDNSDRQSTATSAVGTNASSKTVSIQSNNSNSSNGGNGNGKKKSKKKRK
ncbi:breast carcinoma-amplified sequence 3 homolog isoform X2 [Uranotaenia lowii]|uniref:breast carcinoma-amplified sequence 3 homolog isoform X2 n=1 Tax=Uranotaenia lowii TaxID=190385 RepID=UPI0024785D34|nr:breast carcinoma-amplified sequence 3 homolog isoform X2 [Uranotaenia lowii]